MQEYLEELIEKHDFIVRAVLTEPDVLEVDFAGKQYNSYMFFPQENAEFITDGICQTISLLISINEQKQEIVYIPAFLARLYVLCHIYAECRNLELPYNIIKFFRLKEKDLEKTTLVKLINFKLSKADEEKEIKINQAVYQIWEDFSKINNFDSEMRSAGLSASFNIIKGLII